MTSLYRHLSAQEIVNWVTTADACVHTADADETKLSSLVASAVCIGLYCTALLLLLIMTKYGRCDIVERTRSDRRHGVLTLSASMSVSVSAGQHAVKTW